MLQAKVPFRGWEYARSGDYHRNLDPNWSYTPTYLQKVKQVQEFVLGFPKTIELLDLACGEGVLVERFRELGYRTRGLDLNYESEIVQRGDARELPYDDETFDVVLFLDALEHLAFEDQPTALAEINRVLKPGGYLFLSVPNLAHFNSRFQFFFKGSLDRTDIETNHPGERPLKEYCALLQQTRFSIEKQTGITFTVPYIYRRLICQNPAKYLWLHDRLEFFARKIPALAMLTNFACRKTEAMPQHANNKSKLKIENDSGNPQIFSILTHLTEAEKLKLYETANNLAVNNPIIVEIGSYLGASTSFLATGVKAKDGKVFAVDTWENQGMSEGARDTYEEFLQNTYPLKQWIIPLRGRSTEIAQSFDKKIDLLFIDGDHSYEGVSADIKAWLPKLKDNGTVIFHDWGWAEGVRRSIDEMISPFLNGQEPEILPNMYLVRLARTSDFHL